MAKTSSPNSFGQILLYCNYDFALPQPLAFLITHFDADGFLLGCWKTLE